MKHTQQLFQYPVFARSSNLLGPAVVNQTISKVWDLSVQTLSVSVASGLFAGIYMVVEHLRVALILNGVTEADMEIGM